MSYKLPWTSPYPQLSRRPASEINRLTVEVLASDRAAILSVAINPAILSLICQTAIKTTAEYVRNNALTYADAAAFVDHICKCTFAEPAPVAPPHDVAVATPRVRARAKATGSVLPVPREETSHGRGGKG